MTRKVRKDEAKQRMREYLKTKGIPHTQAEVTCNFKRGYLSAGGVVGSDKLANFVTAYPDCDLYYIITGNHNGDPRLRTIVDLLRRLEANNANDTRLLKSLNTMVTNMVTKK